MALLLVLIALGTAALWVTVHAGMDNRLPVAQTGAAPSDEERSVAAKKAATSYTRGIRAAREMSQRADQLDAERVSVLTTKPSDDATVVKHAEQLAERGKMLREAAVEREASAAQWLAGQQRSRAREKAWTAFLCLNMLFCLFTVYACCAAMLTLVGDRKWPVFFIFCSLVAMAILVGLYRWIAAESGFAIGFTAEIRAAIARFLGEDATKQNATIDGFYNVTAMFLLAVTVWLVSPHARLHAAPDEPLDCEKLAIDLHNRGMFLRRILYVGMGALVSHMLHVASLFHWLLGAVEANAPAQLAAWKELTGAALLSRGMHSVLLLASIYLPAAYLLRSRAERLGCEQFKDKPTPLNDRNAWLTHRGLLGDNNDFLQLKPILALLAPLATGAAATLLQSVAG